ncbi:FtsX-like permease family protein [Candidatus Bipolaricaulota bacterium]|nr:FtsX-like permease family protein [Candidatus Bipolaricaulota bacterium]
MKAAIRHLLRNRRRSILALAAVIVPVFLLVLVLAMVGGMERDMFLNTIRFETGHLQVRRESERPKGGALPLIRDSAALVDLVGATEGVEWYMVRLELPALAASPDRSVGILVQGVDPDRVKRISPIYRMIEQGRYLEAGDDGVVVGVQLLKMLGLAEGDGLILLGAHPDVGMGVARPAIVGIFNPLDPELGRVIVQVDLAVAQRLVRAPGAITSIVAQVGGVDGPWDAWKIDQVVARLAERIPDGYEVIGWAELAPEFAGFMRILRPLTYGIMVIFFLLGGFVVLNILYLSILERTRELGVIAALGATRARVMSMVLSEATIIASVGAVVGALSGAGLVGLIERLGGIPLPGLYTEMMAMMGMETVLRLRITGVEIVLSALAMIVVAVLSAWYPAFKAAKLEPVEAMRHA